MAEPDYMLHAYGAHICYSILDKAIQELRSKTNAPIPNGDWLIASHSKQFRLFAGLWERDAPDIVTEEKELRVKVPVEINYANVKWIADDSLPPDVVKIKAGEFRGLIKTLYVAG